MFDYRQEDRLQIHYLTISHCAFTWNLRLDPVFNLGDTPRLRWTARFLASAPDRKNYQRTTLSGRSLSLSTAEPSR